MTRLALDDRIAEALDNERNELTPSENARLPHAHFAFVYTFPSTPLAQSAYRSLEPR
jgi:hypothetical protein